MSSARGAARHKHLSTAARQNLYWPTCCAWPTVSADYTKIQLAFYMSSLVLPWVVNQEVIF